MEWMDITRPVREGMAVYSEDEGFRAERLLRKPPGAYNLSRFTMGAHCGSHLDAPRHFLEHGATVEAAPLDLLNGRVTVLRICGDFRPESVPEGTRRLLLAGEFSGLSEPEAEILVRRGVRLLGVSTLSVADGAAEGPVHEILLSSGVWILENLALEQVEAGEYRLMCLPLRLDGLEAAPVRAALMRRE